MSSFGRLPPISRPMVLVLAVGAIAIVLFVVRMISGPGEIHYRTVAVVQPLPDRSSSADRETISSGSSPDLAGQPVNPAYISPDDDPVKPAAPDLSLVDASPFGPLPRVAADGRLPLVAYGRPFDPTDTRPKIAILVANLGQQADATNAALHLPGVISMSFSPYSDDLPSLFERARLAGHEVVLELPMEPRDYPTNDPGPHTLRTSGTVDANVERLTWVLSRAPGYFALAGRGGAFAQSAEADPILEAIAAKGVGMIEIDGKALEKKAASADLAYISASAWIDQTPSAAAIDQALSDLEAEAQAEGHALGIAEAYPVSLQRLVEWTTSLDQKGLALVPVSALLIEQASLLDSVSQASNLAPTPN